MTTPTLEAFVESAPNLEDLKKALHVYHPEEYHEGLSLWARFEKRQRDLEVLVESCFDAGCTESEMLRVIPAGSESAAKVLWDKQLEGYGVWGHREFQAAAMSAGWADECREVNG
jgi:hypothetical protein